MSKGEDQCVRARQGCVFKSGRDSVFPSYCVFQSRGLLIQVPEIVML